MAEKAARDFSSLITAILRSAHSALEATDADHPAREHIMKIQGEGSRAASLTQQLLLVRGGRLGEARVFDPGATVDRMLPDMKRILGDDITVCRSIQPGLRNMIGDEAEIELMIMNLIVNAREAMPEGGTLRIGLDNVAVSRSECASGSEARPGDFIRLSVADEGPGIDPTSLPHIFDPFFTTKNLGGGAGLGLSVVYGIVKQHDGWVTISSRRGSGSTFTAFLPASAEKI
ncbi:MAG: hypothetical protein HY770_03915 [Chitinivibrionia bacterium]|nr:hypothetical protein [Chitinivibrionia bacterium]